MSRPRNTDAVVSDVQVRALAEWVNSTAKMTAYLESVGVPRGQALILIQLFDIEQKLIELSRGNDHLVQALDRLTEAMGDDGDDWRRK